MSRCHQSEPAVCPQVSDQKCTHWPARQDPIQDSGTSLAPRGLPVVRVAFSLCCSAPQSLAALIGGGDVRASSPGRQARQASTTETSLIRNLSPPFLLRPISRSSQSSVLRCFLAVHVRFDVDAVSGEPLRVPPHRSFPPSPSRLRLQPICIHISP